MIKGVGIDIVQISRISKIILSNEASFIRKILHDSEKEEYNKITLEKTKAQFLSSRWAVKEALVKATGDKSIIYSSVKISKDIVGKPSLEVEKYKNDEFMCSISHEEEYSVAVVIQLNKMI